MSGNITRVLICDDSILIRRKLREFLLSIGCSDVYEASDGLEAVNAYMDYKPDLVFMDIVMPKKTGVEALREIIDFDPDAKVIIASSVGTQSHLKIAIEIGAYDFLQKPIDFAQVEKIIANISKRGK